MEQGGTDSATMGDVTDGNGSGEVTEIDEVQIELPTDMEVILVQEITMTNRARFQTLRDELKIFEHVGTVWKPSYNRIVEK